MDSATNDIPKIFMEFPVNAPEVWGLPSNPDIPPTTVLHDILEWVGMAVVPAVIAGFGMNYLIARIRIAREGKSERS